LERQGNYQKNIFGSHSKFSNQSSFTLFASKNSAIIKAGSISSTNDPKNTHFVSNQSGNRLIYRDNDLIAGILQKRLLIIANLVKQYHNENSNYSGKFS
jgi:hypothetical protein